MSKQMCSPGNTRGSCAGAHNAGRARMYQGPITCPALPANGPTTGISRDERVLKQPSRDAEIIPEPDVLLRRTPDPVRKTFLEDMGPKKATSKSGKKKAKAVALQETHTMEEEVVHLPSPVEEESVPVEGIESEEPSVLDREYK